MLLLGLAGTALGADGVTASVERLALEAPNVYAIVRIHNGTLENFRVVGIRCAFLSRGTTVGTVGSTASNVRPGASVFAKLAGPGPGREVDKAQCSISHAHR